MKKLFLSIISVFMIICSFSTVFADDYDYFNSSYGTWSYYHISQVNNSTSADYNEVGLSIGGLSFPIPNYTGAVSLVYQFNKSYSGTLTFNYDSSVSSAYKLIYGDYGAKINYSSGSSVNVSITDCTRLEIIVLGSNATKINSIDYSLSATAGNTQIDYSSKLDAISQVLLYIDNSLEDIETNTDLMINFIDGIEGYIDGLETTLSSVNSTLTNISNAVSNGNINLSNINSNVSNIYLLLNNIYDRFGNSLSSIIDNTDTLESLLTNINSSINSLSTQLSPALANVPTYSLSGYMYFRRFNNSFNVSNLHYPNYVIQNTVTGAYNSDRRIYVKPNSSTLIAFLANGTVSDSTFPYYLLNSSTVSSYVDVSYSYTHLANYRIAYILINNTYSSTISISFDYAGNSSIYIVPLYLGDVALMTDEIQMITQYFADNTPDYTNDLDNIADLLTDLGVKFDQFNFDNSDLISILNDLYDSVSQLQTQITVTNNLQLGIVPQTSYMAYTFFQRFAEGGIIKQSGSYGVPFYTMVQSTSGNYNSQRRIRVPAGKTYLLCFGATNDISDSNFPYYFYSNYGNAVTVTYSDYRYSRNIEYIIITNNYESQISVSFDYVGSNIPVYPLYLGDIELMTQEMQMITQYKVESTNPDYTELLEEIYDAINSLDLNVSINVTNNDVQNVTNNFETNMDIVNNVEVNFNTSFESSNTNITNNDLTLDFTNLQPSITLYHDIFRSFYNIDLFKYVIIICMVGGVVLVLLG